MRWWRWLYRENPAGTGWIQIAEHEGKIVGQSAIVPILIKIGTEVITGVQGIDAMIHPEYRHQGIYVALSRSTHSEAAKEGIYIGFTFPNEKSHPIEINKLDWFNVAPLQVIIKPDNWGNALKMRFCNKMLLVFLTVVGNIISRIFYRAKSAPVIDGMTISKVLSFDERINNFWDRVSSKYPIMVLRNKDYLNWRYNVPGINYTVFLAEKNKEILGYLVLRCTKRQQVKAGIIFDILAQSNDIARCLIFEAVEYCKREKTDLTYTIMLREELREAFRDNGFMSIKGQWFCAYSHSKNIPKDLLMDPGNWFILIGDSDCI
jgi:GNAT superfamily N-acetyltransferase